VSADAGVDDWIIVAVGVNVDDVSAEVGIGVVVFIEGGVLVEVSVRVNPQADKASPPKRTIPLHLRESRRDNEIGFGFFKLPPCCRNRLGWN